MLTDDERKTLADAADMLQACEPFDDSLEMVVIAKLRAIAAPRTAPSPTPDACAAIERAATWIELGEVGGTPDAGALVATLREFVRKPRVVIDGIAVHGDGWAPDVGWGLFGDVAIAHPDFIAAECAINLATAYRPEVP